MSTQSKQQPVAKADGIWEHLTQQLHQLQRAADACSAQAADINAERLQLTAQAAEQSRLAAHLDAQQQQILKQQSEMQDLRAAMECDRSSLEAQAENLRAERNDLQASQQAAEQLLADLDERQTRLRKQQSDVEEARVSIESHRLQLESRWAELEDQVRAMQQRAADAEQLKQSTDQTLAQIKVERQCAEAENAALEQARAQLVGDRETLSNREASLTTEERRIAQMRETLEPLCREAEERLANLEKRAAELDAQTRELETARTAVAAQRHEFEAAAQLHEQHRKQLEETRRDLEITARTLSDRRAQLDAQQTEIEQSQESIQVMRLDLEARGQMLEVQSTHLDARQMQLDEQRVALDTDRREVRNLKKNVALEKDLFHEQQLRLEEAQRDLASREADFLQASSNLETSRKAAEVTFSEGEARRAMLEEQAARLEEGTRRLEEMQATVRAAAQKLTEKQQMVRLQTSRSVARLRDWQQKRRLEMAEERKQLRLNTRKTLTRLRQWQLAQNEEIKKQTAEAKQQAQSAVQHDAQVAELRDVLQRRRARLGKLRTLIRETRRKVADQVASAWRQSESLKAHAEALETQRHYAREVVEKRNAVMELQHLLSEAEQRMIRRWGIQHALSWAGRALICLLLCLGVSYQVSDRLATRTYVASAAARFIANDTATGDTWIADQLKTFTSDPMLDRTAVEIRRNGYTGPAQPEHLRQVLSRLTIHSPTPGMLYFELTGPDSAEITAVLDGVMRAVARPVPTANKDQEKVASPSSSPPSYVIAQPAKLAPNPIFDNQFQLNAIIFGGSVLVTLLMVTVLGFSLIRTRRAATDEIDFAGISDDKQWQATAETINAPSLTPPPAPAEETNFGKPLF